MTGITTAGGIIIYTLDGDPSILGMIHGTTVDGTARGITAVGMIHGIMDMEDGEAGIAPGTIAVGIHLGTTEGGTALGTTEDITEEDIGDMEAGIALDFMMDITAAFQTTGRAEVQGSTEGVHQPGHPQPRG